mmetsp:Transcript_27627/g.68897  ORF Transcript_27627/g.68897 Transcript_27627/m.68897 type:complete len:243 (-) Transcript_27627:464-1192(-)
MALGKCIYMRMCSGTADVRLDISRRLCVFVHMWLWVWLWLSLPVVLVFLRCLAGGVILVCVLQMQRSGGAHIVRQTATTAALQTKPVGHLVAASGVRDHGHDTGERSPEGHNTLQALQSLHPSAEVHVPAATGGLHRVIEHLTTLTRRILTRGAVVLGLSQRIGGDGVAGRLQRAAVRGRQDGQWRPLRRWEGEEQPPKSDGAGDVPADTHTQRLLESDGSAGEEDEGRQAGDGCGEGEGCW